MKRPFVPLHRSVRGIRLTGKRLALMAAVACGSSFAVVSSARYLLRFHESLCQHVLAFAHIPMVAASELVVLPWLNPVRAPVVTVPALASAWPVMAGAAASVLAILTAFHRAYPLARSFLAFLIALVVAAAGLTLFRPGFSISSDGFTALWLRTQTVLWILLPWVLAFFVLPIEPSALRGIGWICLVGAYGLVWSSLRLAFCLAVLHHTGTVFLTALWCGIGPLCDVLYILVFYSLAVRSASRRMWGGR